RRTLSAQATWSTERAHSGASLVPIGAQNSTLEESISAYMLPLVRSTTPWNIMFKPTGPWVSLITLGLTFGLLADARAQHRVDVFGDPIDQIDPLDFKDLAKERLAVASADPKELAKAMLDVARTEF